MTPLPFLSFFQQGLPASPAVYAARLRAQGTINWTALADAEYSLCECLSCRLVFQRHIPTQEMLDRVYNEMAQSTFLAKLEHEQLTVDAFQAIAGELAVLFRLLGKPPHETTLLDFGFGHGRWSRVAKAMGATVFVTEFGDDKYETASAIGVHLLSDEEVTRRRFDIVHTEQVFEHLADPASEFRRLAAVTDGIFKVAVPKHGNVRRLVETIGFATKSPFDRRINKKPAQPHDDDYISIAPLEHLNVYSDQAMTQLAQINRMELISKVRRGAVSVDLTSLKGSVSSGVAAAKMVGRVLLKPASGYCLFRPAPLH